MQIRFVVAGAGVFLGLLGLAFLLIAANTFSTTVFMLGLALAAGGLWPELQPQLSRAWQIAWLWLSQGANRLAIALQAWRQASAARAAAATWPHIGDYRVEVVGESMYQQPLVTVARGKPTGPLGLPCEARLVPEPKNPADANAVAVFINRQKVGYLSRPNARAFRRRLAETGDPLRFTTCAAIIRGGGFRDDGEQMFYGVWLDLEPL